MRLAFVNTVTRTTRVKIERDLCQKVSGTSPALAYRSLGGEDTIFASYCTYDIKSSCSRTSHKTVNVYFATLAFTGTYILIKYPPNQCACIAKSRTRLYVSINYQHILGERKKESEKERGHVLFIIQTSLTLKFVHEKVCTQKRHTRLSRQTIPGAIPD